MKYLRKYENTEYNEGDIIVLDLKKLRSHYVNSHNVIALDFLSLLESPVQELHVDIDNDSYYIKHKLWLNGNSNNFYLRSDEISRKASVQQIEEFKLRQKIDKFNV